MSVGQDNGWTLALIFPVVMEFNKSIVDVPTRLDARRRGIRERLPGRFDVCHLAGA
jgi:hypothetical protein